MSETEEDLLGDCEELQGVLLNTESVEQFLHEMAVLAARSEHYSWSPGTPQAGLPDR